MLSLTRAELEGDRGSIHVLREVTLCKPMESGQGNTVNRTPRLDPLPQHMRGRIQTPGAKRVSSEADHVTFDGVPKVTAVSKELVVKRQAERDL